MIGMIVFTIYLTFLTDFSLIFKILTAFNSTFGVIFMLSYLVTTYQQYVSYMETQNVMNDILQNSPNGNPEVMPLFPGLPPPKLELPETQLTPDNKMMKGGLH